jgi:hypothetical protein
MACSKCKQKKVINNLDSPDHIQIAKNVYVTIILAKSMVDYDELDKMEIHRAYDTLYPHSSARPSLEDAINQIRIGIELYGIKYTRK